MTPLQAILKNAVMLIVFFLLYYFHEGWSFNNKLRRLVLVPVLAAFIFPFILNPVELDYSESYLNKPENNFKIELD
jgi:hypothetical protein